MPSPVLNRQGSLDQIDSVKQLEPTAVNDEVSKAPRQKAGIGSEELEEVLIVDVGSLLTPAQMVEKKLLRRLRTSWARFFNRATEGRSPSLFGPRGQQLP
jgi:predicted DCC family thiol-disulfide oxidoreductase YuxK